MARKNKYKPGDILTVHQVVDGLADGGYVFWNHKLMHKSFLSSMPARVVVSAANKKIIRNAELNEATA
jgi:hypothetical protein